MANLSILYKGYVEWLLWLSQSFVTLFDCQYSLPAYFVAKDMKQIAIINSILITI